MVSWSFTHWRDVSVARKSKPANQTRSGASKHFPEIPSQAENCEASKCLRCMFGLATNVRRMYLKLCEASWRLREVVSRTGFRVVVDPLPAASYFDLGHLASTWDTLLWYVTSKARHNDVLPPYLRVAVDQCWWNLTMTWDVSPQSVTFYLGMWHTITSGILPWHNAVTFSSLQRLQSRCH